MRHKNFIFRRLKISIKINPKRNDESSFQLKSFSMPKIRGFFFSSNSNQNYIFFINQCLNLRGNNSCEYFIE